MKTAPVGICILRIGQMTTSNDKEAANKQIYRPCLQFPASFTELCRIF